MPVRRDHEELVVITKTYDLILWSCHHTGKFPRRNVPTNRNNNVGFRVASTLPCQNSQAFSCGACQGAKSRPLSCVESSLGGSAK